MVVGCSVDLWMQGEKAPKNRLKNQWFFGTALALRACHFTLSFFANISPYSSYFVYFPEFFPIFLLTNNRWPISFWPPSISDFSPIVWQKNPIFQTLLVFLKYWGQQGYCIMSQGSWDKYVDNGHCLYSIIGLSDSFLGTFACLVTQAWKNLFLSSSTCSCIL